MFSFEAITVTTVGGKDELRFTLFINEHGK